jgi:hypothetical protein
MMSEQRNDFTVKDRRIFSQEGKTSEENMNAESSPRPEAESRFQKEEKEYTGTAEKDYLLPEINFPTFIFSLSSSVYVQLGLLEEPESGKRIKNLPLAKQTIDILGMLEEKTRGNLTKDEENMLKNILYDLRMLYIREKE